MSEVILAWWDNPVTVVLAATVFWGLLALASAGLVAVVRLGGITLGGLLSQRPNLLPGLSRRGDAFEALVLLLGIGEGLCSLAYFAAVVRVGRAAGAGVLGMAMLVILGWLLATATALLVVRGSRVEGLARVMLLTLRPVAPLLPLLAEEHEEPQEEDEREEDDELDEHEVQAFIGAGRDAGILELEEAKLIESIVELSDTVTREVMTPRTDMVALPMSADFDFVQKRFAETMFTRIPVYRDTVDRIEGMVHVKEVLRAAAAGQRPNAGALLRDVLVIPETKPVAALLREFQATRQQLAVVVDEYGGTSGIVTLEDVLEEIVGEIQDEHQREDPDVENGGDGSFLVVGNAHAEVLEELFGVEVGEEGFDSVAGLVLDRLGHVPRAGEKLVWRGLEIEVLETERRRLRRVRVRRLDTVS